MRGILWRVIAATILGTILTAGVGLAQDFQKSYSIPAGGVIRVGNVSGGVKIIGYNESNILVLAYKEGPDRDLVQIEDKSEADRIVLSVRYPERRNCNASVNFEVRVPSSTGYNFDRISSVSGNVEVRNVTGQIRAESVSGDVLVTDVTGLVSARTVSGDVQARINKLQGAGDMRFDSISGSVIVTAPAGLDAGPDCPPALWASQSPQANTITIPIMDIRRSMRSLPDYPDAVRESRLLVLFSGPVFPCHLKGQLTSPCSRRPCRPGFGRSG